VNTKKVAQRFKAILFFYFNEKRRYGIAHFIMLVKMKIHVICPFTAGYFFQIRLIFNTVIFFGELINFRYLSRELCINGFGHYSFLLF